MNQISLAQSGFELAHKRTRKPIGRNPAWRGDFRQEKGPGDYPSPCVWWSWRDLNPRPQIFHAQFYMFSGLI